MPTPKVFISYSHDSPEHADRVLTLSNRLRSDGIDCILDQYEPAPSEGWPRWMDKQIPQADFVLMICTETYYKRVMGDEKQGTGRGVRWEGNLIYNQIYQNDTKNTRFIPVLFQDCGENNIPAPLQGFTYYLIDNKEGYEDLYRRLTNQLPQKPELGELKQLPTLSRRTDFFNFKYWNLPMRNTYFVGREEILTQLHQILTTKSSMALVQAITGLGGIGKTQTALEYAYRNRDDYQAIFWVTANTIDALNTSFGAIAELLDLPEKALLEQSKIVVAVKRWLETHESWLLIFDNVEDPNLVKDFIPQFNGTILVTSRHRILDKLGIVQPIAIDKMIPSEAEEFLKLRTGQPTNSSEEAEALTAILKELDYLPLALEQAGAYIKELQLTFSEYYQSYKQRGLELLEQSGPVTGEYPQSVRTTWALNFSKVAEISPAAADLLYAMALMDPDKIPFELITAGVPELGPNLAKEFAQNTDPVKIKETLKPLTKYSLVNLIDTNTFKVHRLVQAVLYADLDHAGQLQWAERVVRAVNLAFPDVNEYSNWPLCDRLLSQALRCTKLIKEYGFKFYEAGRLLNQTGLYLKDRARYYEAEPLCHHCLAIFEKALGPIHPDVATCLNNLGLLYEAQGRYNDAAVLYERSLAIDENVYGPDHFQVANDLNNLALIYSKQDRHEDVELLLLRSLAIHVKKSGLEHPDVARFSIT